LLGIIPLGVFVLFHLVVNASVGFGPDDFQNNVERIHALGGFVVPLEIGGIFLPLLFHALLGFQIWLSGQSNTAAYQYGGNYRYLFQRISGIIAFFFILFHVWQFHWLGAPFGGGAFDAHKIIQDQSASLTVAQGLRGSLLAIPIWIFYVIGVICTVYHLANGIWTALITWGVTIGVQSQRASGYACAAFGVVVGIVGLSAVYNFGTLSNDTKTVQVAPADDSVPASMTIHPESAG